MTDGKVTDNGVSVQMLTRPQEWLEIGGVSGISNYDFSVDPGIEEDLRKGRVWTRYAGWNFNGQVWFSSDQFHCEVWCYHSHRETISAPDLEALMHAVSSEYGYE